MSNAIDGAPSWVSGMLAGAQGALLSLLVVVAPALAAYVATSADPTNAEVGWPRSVAVGAVLWLMGHGAIVEAGGATMTIIPLGITVLSLFTAQASARRSARSSLSAWLAGICGYLTFVVVVVLLVGQAGPMGVGVGSLARTGVGVVAVAAAGLGAGVVARGRLRDVLRPVWSAVPAPARVGIRAGVLVAAMLVAVAAVVVCVWAVSGRAQTGDMIAGLGLDTFSGLLLAIAQLAIAPNLVVWGLAWVAGPGFVIGEGTVFAPSEVVSGPMPALPLFGALPSPGSAGGLVRWMPIVVLAAGVVSGWWLRRRFPSGWVGMLRVTGCAAVVAGVVTGGVVATAGGSVGPGRLAVVGGSGVLVGFAVAGLSLLGMLLVTVPITAGWCDRAVLRNRREAKVASDL